MENTHLGLTYENYGKKCGIVSTHLSGPEIIEDESLVPNSLIVSSPTVGDFTGSLTDKIGDQASHALFFTDHNGKAARLTYTIKPGNGLVVNAYENIDGVTNYSNYPYSPDTLSFEIDKDSLKTISLNGQLQVSKPDIIDNYTLMVTQETGSTHSYISVITANLEKATDIKYGIVRGDNTTISINQGIATVNTQNLDYVDDASETPGIVRPVTNPGKTIESSNGILSVLTENLDKATDLSVGVVQVDGTTIKSNDGTINVDTSCLDKAMYDPETGLMSYGIVATDNHTIEFKKDANGNIRPGVLYANSKNMASTGFDEEGKPYFGVIKLDPKSFGIDTSNCTYVKRFDEVIALLNRYLDDYDYIISWLTDHENRITKLENQNVEMISSFQNTGTHITILDEPTWDPVSQHVISDEKHYSAQFSIVTNCIFNIRVEYENNVAPGIQLYQVKLGDNAPVNASGLSNYMFASTNMNESTLNFDFICNNFDSQIDDGSATTIVRIRVSSINDESVYREGYHMFKRWNMNNYIEPVPQEPVVTYQTCTEEEYEPAGEQYKELYIGTEGNYEAINDDTQMENGETISSDSFDIFVKEDWVCKKTTYRQEYHDGEAYGDAEIVGVESISAPRYQSLTLSSDGALSRTSTNGPTIYYAYVDAKTYHRESTINNNHDYGWELDTNTRTDSNDGDEAVEQSWLHYYIASIALNSANSAERPPCNTLNVMSIRPISTYDRKAVLTLSIVDPECVERNDDYSSWVNTEVTIEYIEDIVENDINVSVESEIPQSTRGSIGTGDVEYTLMNVSISRSSNVAFDNPWSVYAQYCFNTIEGNTTKNENDLLSIESLNYMNSVQNNRGSQNEQTDMSASMMSQPFNKLRVDMNASTTDTTVSFILKSVNNTVNAYIRYDHNAVALVGLLNGEQEMALSGIDNGDILLTNDQIKHLIPLSVINYVKSQIAPESTEPEQNLISGFRIVNCVVTGINQDYSATIDDATQKLQNITKNANSTIHSHVTWNSYGTWPTYVAQANNITFGNAFISNINIKPWDDIRMEMEFNIIGGDLTNIPAGAQIGFIVPYGSIVPNVVLYNNSDSYEYTEWYDHIIISNDNGWGGSSTKIKLILNNTLPVDPGPNNVQTWQVIAKNGSEQTVYNRDYDFSGETNGDTRFETKGTQVYVNGDNGGMKGMTTENIVKESGIKSTRGTDNQTLAQHQQTNNNGPMVQSITGIRFNFVISATANGKTTSMHFAASTNALSNKVTFAPTVNYSTGASKDVSITNAFYVAPIAPNVSGDDYIEKQEQTNGTLADLLSRIEELETKVGKTEATSSTTTK